MKTILLIILGLSIGSTVFPDFSMAGDIVTDNKTGLQWQDNEIGSKTSWRNAIDRCENLSLGNHNDWRLPNKNELLSIVDYSKSFPAINGAFTKTAYGNGGLYDKEHYWSSSTAIGSHYQTHRPTYTSAWTVPFACGFSYGRTKTQKYYVRCVRLGQ